MALLLAHIILLEYRADLRREVASLATGDLRKAPYLMAAHALINTGTNCFVYICLRQRISCVGSETGLKSGLELLTSLGYLLNFLTSFGCFLQTVKIIF
ncbi:hypothetical protein EVAR_38627_1 [Eumeta japonica]|uniref:Uncharacterized protein n=1 Tax=Eumeta variegata TaxID=151549 RepID=A0A4C1XWR2_EUMVA|nr:hypothetical protein EVAR_38627_1 [Eumeta japonica]